MAKKEQTALRIIAAVKESKGLLTLAAQKAGLDYSTVWRYTQKYPSVRKAVEESKEVMLDFAEGKLYQAISAGDNTAIIFFLKTKGKSRGYIERTEFTGQGGAPLIPTTIQVVSEAAKTATEQIIAGKGTE